MVGVVIEVLPPVGLRSIGFEGRSNPFFDARKEVLGWYVRKFRVGVLSDRVKVRAFPRDVTCIALGASAIIAGAVDVFVDFGNFVLVEASAYKGGADYPFLDVGESFADACGFLVDLPEASSGVLVFVNPFCVCACTCSGLG